MWGMKPIYESWTPKHSSFSRCVLQHASPFSNVLPRCSSVQIVEPILFVFFGPFYRDWLRSSYIQFHLSKSDSSPKIRTQLAWPKSFTTTHWTTSTKNLKDFTTTLSCNLFVPFTSFPPRAVGNSSTSRNRSGTTMWTCITSCCMLAGNTSPEPSCRNGRILLQKTQIMTTFLRIAMNKTAYIWHMTTTVPSCGFLLAWHFFYYIISLTKKHIWQGHNISICLEWHATNKGQTWFMPRYYERASSTWNVSNSNWAPHRKAELKRCPRPTLNDDMSMSGDAVGSCCGDVRFFWEKSELHMLAKQRIQL